MELAFICPGMILRTRLVCPKCPSSLGSSQQCPFPTAVGKPKVESLKGVLHLTLFHGASGSDLKVGLSTKTATPQWTVL